MANNQRLELKQAQTLVMTPQLQQSIKFLQLSSIELSNYISQELENNPLLSRAEGDEEDHSHTTLTEKTPENTPDNVPAIEQTQDSPLPDNDSFFQENYQPAWEGNEPHSKAIYEAGTSAFYEGANQHSYGFNDNDQEWAANTTEAISLKQHILNQVAIDLPDPAQRMIALHLTDLLEDSGYMTTDLSALADTIGCAGEDILLVLGRLQTFDPPGVFARSVAECLALQLKDKNRYDPIIAQLLDNLDLLARGELKQLQKICQVSEEELLEMVKEVKQLNPKPGSIFSTDTVQTVQPDVYLKQDANGRWIVELNSDALPRLLINKRYHAEVTSKNASETDRKYLTEQLQSANWLIKALDQRAQTILKVATEIVSRQQEFFERGIRYLKPLTLTDIAQSLGIHESTVSRVTNHKYLATHLGVYEMKYFFSSSIHSASGEEEFSSKSIRYIIAEMVQNEKPEAILSDDKIAALLQQRGIDIARRTVAKYREAVGIASSAQRKREKRLGT